MRIHAIEGNRQKLDGGAMYGNCPRPLWSQWSPPDELGRITLACRAMLVECARGLVLCETGIGAFFEPKLRERFGVQGDTNELLAGLAARGIAEDDIAAVLLSHLHFDHAGGLLTAWREGAAPALAFPRAQYIAGRRAFERAEHPHARDRASFVPGLTELLRASGRLVLVDGETCGELGPEFRFQYSDGHTVGLMMAEVAHPDGPVLFASDLIPGLPWMHLPITMGYDRFPEQLIDDKERILSGLLNRGGKVFFTHDPAVALAVVERSPAGKFSGRPVPLA